MNDYKNIFGFTLVELIVVITIVGILSTVGFVSYSGYLAGARDSNRFSQLTKLSDSLQVYAATKSLPLPDDYIEVTASGTVIAYQGYVGVDVLETIDYTNGGKDPRDGSYYTYYVSKNRKNMQLLAFMEEQSSVGMNSQIFAADYTERVPKVYGKRLGVLTESSTNTPVQEVSGVTVIDIITTIEEYTAYFSDTYTITGTGTALASIQNLAKTNGKILKDCKTLLEDNSSLKNQDGVYLLNIGGTTIEGVYCDMTTDGGGWTYATMLADGTTRNFFHSGSLQNITSLTENISTKGNFNKIWSDTQNKDIMLHCFTDNLAHKPYELPFIIYDYPYQDKINLTKQHKEGTPFSSNNLKAKWNNLEYTLTKNYGPSGIDESYYVLEQGSNKRLLMFYTGGQISLSTGSAVNSPGWQSSGDDNHQTINTTNYCVTAIR